MSYLKFTSINISHIFFDCASRLKKVQDLTSSNFCCFYNNWHTRSYYCGYIRVILLSKVSLECCKPGIGLACRDDAVLDYKAAVTSTITHRSVHVFPLVTEQHWKQPEKKDWKHGAWVVFPAVHITVHWGCLSSKKQLFEFLPKHFGKGQNLIPKNDLHFNNKLFAFRAAREKAKMLFEGTSVLHIAWEHC